MRRKLSVYSDTAETLAKTHRDEKYLRVLTDYLDQTRIPGKNYHQLRVQDQQIMRTAMKYVGKGTGSLRIEKTCRHCALPTMLVLGMNYAECTTCGFTNITHKVEGETLDMLFIPAFSLVRGVYSE